MYPSLSASMLFVVLICSLTLAATGQQVEDDWIDPYDMLNYDPSTKTMRKPAEVGRFKWLRYTDQTAFANIAIAMNALKPCCYICCDSQGVCMYALQPANYPNVPTERREHIQDSSQAQQTPYDKQILDLQKQVGGFRVY